MNYKIRVVYLPQIFFFFLIKVTLLTISIGKPLAGAEINQYPDLSSIINLVKSDKRFFIEFFSN